MFEATIVGLRDLGMRFASMADRGLVEIQLEEAAAAASTIQAVYRAHAPHGQRPPAEGREQFYETIEALAVETGAGFQITVDTSNPQLRRWLAEGTGVYAGHGRIYPKSAGGVLGPIPTDDGAPVFRRSIAGMRPQPWEAQARAEAEPLVRAAGRAIGQRVVIGLAGL